ncbi:lycopene cyclase domain-containing protein [Deinococcus cellulosilyticus]|uniref:Phytoene synthase n=1 Tax=Deinococcus cellulosilyticus (strain DSM 18568 / NBRC 106333 / KACC 11606 / 5516J-15) TaxID=1223518 RepID=A0A511N1H3_DEIC1|nr:lycopene cyclase domain-containing protein [Deinococcus cellulosilyticus]GEM46639.1 phytoene synthase [Deinococcus cellulosilyticus NBRC 106333 = KACC 11606]
MTYLEFLLIFLLPPLTGLLVWAWRVHRQNLPLGGRYQSSNRRSVWFLLLLPVLAVVYTTPWDNYLVYSQVWTYPDERVIGKILYVPVEEYLFFVLQSLLGGLLFLLLLRILQTPPEGKNPLGRGLGMLFHFLLTVAGVWLLQSPSGVYLGLILVWACPVLFFQWWFGGDLLSGKVQGARLLGTFLLTVYLGLCDMLAINLEIWSISETYTTGVMLGHLPLEEGVFFLVTSVLLMDGLALFLHPEAESRYLKLKHKFHPLIKGKA